ncbi:hypothetical protein JDW19_14190 [Paenibacillus polymyxa]|uniref:Uncharacterized protein n=1 Tax=Paenibacillus polymyxa TaxID=1406 RepID=A0A8I1IWB8_PAEPO|nr:MULTISPECIES: hypothetical protein [Paenibacillus]KAF6570860.1 hypothetical protein G9G53_18540 [Paenibacillus sp. EKM206P]KAF6587923.1 hypothetical protein G9G52_16015 [Paenibacillus sp. EKM205P]MBM0634263.1 hypothetical protein [Paenibacillus polymyxa]
MNNQLKALIESQVPSDKLIITHLVDSEITVKWIPLMTIGEHNPTIGLSTDAQWVINENQGIRILDEPWKYLRLLVLLEQQRKTVHNSLREALANYKIFVNLEDVFPFAEIVKIGFEQKSDYWVELALNWFEELSLIKQSELVDYLSKIVNARWASQKLRHRVRKILRNIEQK